MQNLINEGSSCIFELIESQYTNISTYRPLGSYIKLNSELRRPKKYIFSIKNNAQNCFLWCHVSHINPIKLHRKRVKQTDKKNLNDVNCDGV